MLLIFSDSTRLRSMLTAEGLFSKDVSLVAESCTIKGDRVLEGHEGSGWLRCKQENDVHSSFGWEGRLTVIR